MSVPQLGGAVWAQRTLDALGTILCAGGSAWAELLAAGVGSQQVAALYPFALTDWLAGAKRLQREPAAQQWLIESDPAAKNLLGCLPGIAAQPLYRVLAPLTSLLSNEEQVFNLLLTFGLVHTLTRQPFDFAIQNVLNAEQISTLRAENFASTSVTYAKQIEGLVAVVRAL